MLRFLSYYKEEINATVYCKSGRFGVLEKEYKAVGAHLKPFTLGHFNPLDYYKLYKELKNKNFEAVCDFTGNYAALPLLTAKFAGIDKRLVFFRGSTRHFKETTLRLVYDKLMNKLLYRSATKILSNSKAALDYFYPKKSTKNPDFFEVVYNGINASTFLNTQADLRQELGIPSQAFVIGHVGRVAPAKNHKTIMEVAMKMAKENANVYFVLCGDHTREEFDSVIKNEKFDKQILLLGVRRDVIKVLNTLDCFYFPSITEGQPNALIEAMVAGVPFVASDIDPIKEAVPEAFYDFLVPATESGAAIDKIKYIMNGGKALADKFEQLSVTIKQQYDAGKLFEKFYKNL